MARTHPSISALINWPTDGELVLHEAEQEAIRDMVALRAEGKALRAIADAVRAKGHKISHEGVTGVIRVRPD